ncbi:MAG: XRE family transcriptional regulator [Cyanothece sp. SIO2G6]|nr:XRE family transcriptional regulator [Cyanothece sp. SIO2G6]
MTMTNDVVLGSDNIFEDLGFEPEEAINLRIRADLMLDLKSHIQKQGWSHRETSQFLDVPQTTIDHLMQGEISQFTIDRLIQLLGKAGMTVEVNVVANVG